MFDFNASPERMIFAFIQWAIFAILLLAFVALAWRTLRQVELRANEMKAKGVEMAPMDYVRVGWPVMSFAVMLVLATSFYATMQSAGPRLTTPKTTLKEQVLPGGEIRDLQRPKTTDAERVQQQRALEDETRNRVDLPPRGTSN
jgi:hypothetical protein